MKILIGTGFYAAKHWHADKLDFFRRFWLPNTLRVSDNIVVVDNSDVGFNQWHHPGREIRVLHNLGHMCDPKPKGSRLLGWSFSWILPALVAYCEQCDFVYKEQDCLAFNNRLPAIQKGRAAFGNHPKLECEQSLFWIQHDFILDFVQVYMAIPEPEETCIAEKKFTLVEKMLPGAVARFSIGPGRDRPLPDFRTKDPWYAQKFEAWDLQRLLNDGLI